MEGQGAEFRNSFRRSSQRSNDVFGSSSLRQGKEDDQEALKWAALHKLPTYNRLRRGILPESEGQINMVEIQKLGFEERNNLLKRLVDVAEKDNEEFLLKLKNRMDRVGIENPTIQVRFQNLNFKAEAYIGNRGVPNVINSLRNTLEEALAYLHVLRNRKIPISILSGDLSGIIKPSRMTLLLGPPGSGKTTFLLALAGKLDSPLKVYGRVSYNGHDMDEFVPQRSSAYISQDDVHIGQLTVRETLAFSARCQGIGTRYEMSMELSKREREAKIQPDPDIDLYMKATALKGQEGLVIQNY